VQPISPDVPPDDPETRGARADVDPVAVFSALDKVVAETPLTTGHRSESAPAGSMLEWFHPEGSQPDRSAPVPSPPPHLSVASGSVNEPGLLPDGMAEHAKPAEAVKPPIAAGAKAPAQRDLDQVSVQPRQGVPSALEPRAAEISGAPDLRIAPAATEAPRGQTTFEHAFRLTESESQAGQGMRGRSLPDRAPFDSALAATRSAVWPLGFALVLGGSLGFAAGYKVASWQHRPEAARAATAAPAHTAEATRESVRGFTESTVHEPAAAATPGTDAALKANAAQPPADARTAAATPAAAAQLLIRSTPAGARVVLDGRDVGETPLTVRDIANGAHTVRVVRDGYVADQRRVIVSTARPEQSLTIALSRPAAAAPSTPSESGQSAAGLYVESRPAGASLFLDGNLVGTTPLQLSEVAAGDHTVTLELDGYQRWSSSVRIVAGARSRVAASLDR
jgi:PEGA domain